MMSVLFTTWSGVLFLVAIVWLSRHLAVQRALRDEKPLTPHRYDSPPKPAPKISVLVAAKDEESNIETCIRTLLTQDYPNFEIITIDDRSTDSTPDILDRLAAENPSRLRVVHITHLTEGWFGKNHAMHEGMKLATGEWLCFTDADCRQVSMNTLSTTVRFAIENQVDFLSVLPMLETKNFWERVIQPVCSAIMIMWFRPERVNNPKTTDAYANGAFMLMKRTVYDSIGGHERIRNELNEDMHLARLAKQNGHRLFVVQNDGLYKTRMYASFHETWRGWSRIFYGCFGTFRRLLISLLVLSFASILPWISLLIAATVCLISSHPNPGWPLVTFVSAAAVVSQQILLARFYRLTQSSPWMAPTYILGAVIAWGMLVSAMTRLGGLRTTVWRGTAYQGTKLVSDKNPHDSPQQQQSRDLSKG